MSLLVPRGRSCSGRATSAARSTPSVSATSTSASSRGLSQPAASSDGTAASSTSAAVIPGEFIVLGRSSFSPSVRRGGLESAPLFVGLEAGGEVVELAGQHPLDVALRELHAVVGHAVLREVVGADLLRPLAGAHLGTAVSGLLRLLGRALG